MRPMLAARGSAVPTSAAWLHEVKWDGMRVLASVRDGQLSLTSRNENDVSLSFPELAGFADPGVAGGRDLVVDGEIVAFTDGRPVFGARAERLHVKNRRRAESLSTEHPVTLIIFDLLELDGLDVTSLPLTDRRAALESLGLAGEHWRVPPAYDDGVVLFEATKAQGLEGILSKRRSSPYRAGRRSEDWLKFPHRDVRSQVVGGWRAEIGSDSRIGALLVGEPGGPNEPGLVYRGRVGSGVAGKAAVRLKAILEPLSTAESPFASPVPAEDAAGTHWVQPTVVVEVASLGLTPQRRLRQPAFLGLRADLDPEDLVDGGPR